MRNIYFLFFLVVVGCTCDEKRLVELTEFEKRLIPIENAKSLNFTNKNDETIAAEVSEVLEENNDVGLDEGCGNFLAEARRFNMEIQDLILRVSLRQSRSYRVEFVITIFESIFSPHCGSSVEELQTFLTDYQFNEFSFQNVFVFEFCGLIMQSEQLTDITKIIFSETNGIEFIEFENGSYLDLIE